MMLQGKPATHLFDKSHDNCTRVLAFSGSMLAAFFWLFISLNYYFASSIIIQSLFINFLFINSSIFSPIFQFNYYSIFLFRSIFISNEFLGLILISSFSLLELKKELKIQLDINIINQMYRRWRNIWKYFWFYTFC